MYDAKDVITRGAGSIQTQWRSFGKNKDMLLLKALVEEREFRERLMDEFFFGRFVM